MTNVPPKKIRILFLAWGYSIHAYRRIKIFADDERFEVGLVSTFTYEIPNVKLFPLTSAKFFTHLQTQKRSETTGNNQWTTKDVFYSVYQLLRRVFSKVHLLDVTSSQLPEDLLNAWRDVKILRRAVREFSPNTIFLQTLLYPSYLAYFLPKRIPQIVTFWNGDVIWWAKWNGIDRILKKRIVTYGARRAAAITVNSQMAFDACIKYGVNQSNIYLIRYPGVNHKLFFPRDKNEARKRLGITQKYVILWPRGLGHYLNSDTFLVSAIDLLKTQPDTLFIMLTKVGNEFLKDYQKSVQEAGYTNNFRWETNVNFEDMPWYHSAADVMVSLSSNDSLPNIMLEAMACGTPIIMSNIAQIREWIVNEKNGLLVNPTDSRDVRLNLEKIFDTGYAYALQKFIKYNRDLVKTNADQEINSEKVKDLVQNIIHT